MTTCMMCEKEFQDVEIEIYGDITICWKCAIRPDYNEKIVEIHELFEYEREREETNSSLRHWGKGVS